MDSKDILYNFQVQIIEAFISQDPELFDVVFEIEGKKLYANKFRLSVISPTFKSMLSDRWHQNKNEAIAINGYKFEDFKECLTFIYSGECNITDSNAFDLLDMAEFYQIIPLKNVCDKYLSEMETNLANVFHMMETAYKYSLVLLKKSMQTFLFHNLNALIECNAFIKAEKFVFEEMIIMKFNIIKPEEFFQAVYQWAENHAVSKKQEPTIDEVFKRNDAIKAQLIPFLPYIQFKKMKLDFLNNFVVERSFLFSAYELNEIIENSKPDYKIKVTNSRGQLLCGILPHDSDAVEVVKSLKNRLSDHPSWWITGCKIPAIPSQIKLSPHIEWYLIYFSNGDIGVKKCCEENDKLYLLAEMITESTGFIYTNYCKIEIE